MTQDYALERFLHVLPVFCFCKNGEIRYILDIKIADENYVIRCEKLSSTQWKISFDKETVDVKNFANTFVYDIENNAVV